MNTYQERAVNVFKYLRDVYNYRNKVVMSLGDSSISWKWRLRDVPDSPDIAVVYRDTGVASAVPAWAQDLDTDGTLLLAMRQPEYEPCPPLPDELAPWVSPEWPRFESGVLGPIEKLPNPDYVAPPAGEAAQAEGDGSEKYIYFHDQTDLQVPFKLWAAKRQVWLEKQLQIQELRTMFRNLWILYKTLERDKDTIEIVVGQGILTSTKAADESVTYPVLVKKVTVRFDPTANVVMVCDTDVPTVLGTTVLQHIPSLHLEAVRDIQQELEDEGYHPLDRRATTEFLHRFAHLISQQCEYVDRPPQQHEVIAPDVAFIVYNDPVFFVRKKETGMRDNLNRIVEYTQHTGAVPEPILNLMGKNLEPLPEPTPRDPSKPRFIDPATSEILLSKEANEEQLEIAKVIEHAPAVVVQGPPGTGKTHTIANLLGHFLAQGKNVLVTSYTSKALDVVKEKVVPELQDLCVSILDDNMQDMASSINRIIAYTSSHSVGELQDKAARLREKRQRLLGKLEEVKQHIYAIRNTEYKEYVWGGKGYSLGEMAAFVETHGDLDYLPGPIEMQRSFPLSDEDTAFLFQTNGLITKEDERELIASLPDPQTLLNDSDMDQAVAKKESLRSDIDGLLDKLQGIVSWQEESAAFVVAGVDCTKSFRGDAVGTVEALLRDNPLDANEPWQLQCLACVMQGRDGAWQQLVAAVTEAQALSQEEIMVDLLGKAIVVPSPAPDRETLTAIRTYLADNGSFGFLGKLLHGNWVRLCQAMTIDGQPVQSARDCDLIAAHLALLGKRQAIGRMWNSLLCPYGVDTWESFGTTQPEWDCQHVISQIKTCLSWYDTTFGAIQQAVTACGLPASVLNDTAAYTKSEDHVAHILSLVYKQLPALLDLATLLLRTVPALDAGRDASVTVLQRFIGKSAVCNDLYDALRADDTAAYGEAYDRLVRIYGKYHELRERKGLLEKVAAVAPGWAKAMEARLGVFGQESMPRDIRQAWQYRQFAQLLDTASDATLPALETDEKRYHDELRRVTTELAETLAWMHLLGRIQQDVSQQQDLKNWKKTVEDMGRRTGKNVASMQKIAQRLMVRCQRTVPAWIMPMGLALEQLTPGENTFDIVIVDEASQSDISSLAILYYAKKIIIVGDNEQVSPEAVGVNTDQILAYQRMYFGNNFLQQQLFMLTTSLYDLGDTTFPSRMLKEHFRCVPDIIGYSNWLAYDGRIKPLRDDSNVPVKPATIAYRVPGTRDGKVNELEAYYIVALMVACMERPEYDGETFGAISLVGDEQAAKITDLASQYIDLRLYNQRRILCGNARQFQGDERGVIFLSMVDSADGDEKLRLVGFGAKNAMKRRYNVAASRAKDQLWVVHSLDPDMNLKTGDIRKGLLDYVQNPKALEVQQVKVKNAAQSPFEEAVAMALIAKGYHIEQQWPVSSYYIDIVAICGDKKIAIECDGETYHSGYDKMLDDMRRQDDLERVGWQFIRIRGSAYFGHPKETIDDVCQKLTAYGIFPETINTDVPKEATALEEAVKRRAEELVHAWKKHEAIPLYVRDIENPDNNTTPKM